MTETNPFAKYRDAYDEEGKELPLGKRQTFLAPHSGAGLGPSLGERFRENMRNGFLEGTLAGSGFGAMQAWFIDDVGKDSPEIASWMRADVREGRRRFEEMPSSTHLSEYAVALAGQIAGGLPTPETFIPAVKFVGPVMRAARPRLARAIEFGVSGAAINVATDPLVQGLNMLSGAQDQFDPLRTAMGAGVGLIIGGGLGALTGGRPRVEGEAPPRATKPKPVKPRPEPSLLTPKEISAYTGMMRSIPELQFDVFERELGGSLGKLSAAAQQAGRQVREDRTATFMELYLSDPDWVARMAPDLVATFERMTEGPRHEQLRAGLAKAREAVAKRRLETRRVSVEGTLNGLRARQAEAASAPEPGQSFHELKRGPLAAAFNRPAEILETDRVKLEAAIERQIRTVHNDEIEELIGTRRGDLTGFWASFEQGLGIAREAGVEGSKWEPFYQLYRLYARRPQKWRANAPQEVAQFEALLDQMDPDFSRWLRRATGKQPQAGKPAEREPAPAMKQVTASELGQLRLPGDTDIRLNRVMNPRPYTDAHEAFKALPPDVVAAFQVHGVGRDQDIVDLLTKGIDSTRTFHSGPPIPGHYGFNTTRIVGSPYLILSDREKMIPETGVKYVVLQDAALPSRARLIESFPGVHFLDAAEAVAFMRYGTLPSLPAARAGLVRGHPADLPDSLPHMATGGRPQAGIADTSPTARIIRDAEAEPPSIQKVARKLAAAIGMDLRQGRIRGAARYESGVARLLHINDVPEIAASSALHIVDSLRTRSADVLASFLEVNATYLSRVTGNVDRFAMGEERFSGGERNFANFVYLYLMAPSLVNKQFRALKADFEATFGRRDPALIAALSEARDGFQVVFSQSSADAMRGRMVDAGKRAGHLGKLKGEIADEGLGETIANVASRMYTATLDDLNPIHRAVRALARIHKDNTGELLDLKSADNAYILARLSRNAHTAGQMDIMHGVTPYGEVRPEGPKLGDALEEAFGSSNWGGKVMEDFAAYTASLRLLVEWRRYHDGELAGPPDAEPMGSLLRLVDEMDAANPQFRSAAMKVSEWAKQLWKLKFESGLINEDAYAAGLARPFYVPVLRDVSERTRATIQRMSKTGKQGVVFKFKGSDRDIINPIQALMLDAYETRSIIARNDVYKALEDLARRVGFRGQQIVERLTPEERKARTPAAEAEPFDLLGTHRAEYKIERARRERAAYEARSAAVGKADAARDARVKALDAARASAEAAHQGVIESLRKSRGEREAIHRGLVEKINARYAKRREGLERSKAAGDILDITAEGRTFADLPGMPPSYAARVGQLDAELASARARADEALNRGEVDAEAMRAASSRAHAAEEAAGKAEHDGALRAANELFDKNFAEASSKSLIPAGRRAENIRDRVMIEALTDREADDAAASVFRAGFKSERGEPIVYVFRDGERHALRLADGAFGQELYAAMTGMNRTASNIFIDLVAKPSTLLRQGVTLSSDFMAANLIRDQLAAFVLVDGFRPFMTTLSGFKSEFTRDEVSRLYNSFGGIMGGAQASAVSKVRVKRDIKSLRRRGYLVERVSSLEGFLSLSEVSETATRLGLFKHAFEVGQKRGLSEREALIEAAWQARDLLDYGRRGSRMLHARRVVTFLNAALQGMDKGVRTLIAPIVKHERGLVLTKQEQEALPLATKAWAKVAALGVFGATLSALYRDDPEYEEISDHLRATHWMVKANGTWFSIPKPFELAFLSNIFERSFEFAYTRDPTLPGRLIEGLGELVLPPTTTPVTSLALGLWYNRDPHSGRAIVPDYQKGLAPFLQYHSYTSELSQQLGKALNVSPAKIDFIVTTVGGTLGRDKLTITNRLIDPTRPEAGLDDMMLLKRFIRDPSRGATSTQGFWQLVGEQGGQMTEAARTYKTLVEAGDKPGAEQMIGRLPAEERAYALLMTHFHVRSKMLHPLSRAGGITKLYSRVRREMVDGMPAGIQLSPGQKRMADDALSRLSMVEMRNALILLGTPGWAHKKLMDPEDDLATIEQISPELVKEIRGRMKKARIYDFAVMRETWPEVRMLLQQQGRKARLAPLARKAEIASGLAGQYGKKITRARKARMTVQPPLRDPAAPVLPPVLR